MKYSRRLRALISMVALTLPSIATPALAQHESSDRTTVGGSASVAWDLYDMKADPTGSSMARRPSSLLRLLFSPTVTFASGLSIPFSFVVTLPETASIQARSSLPGVMNFLQNPANSFSVAPTLGWAQLSLGTQTPQLSELSGGDVQLFGAGIELTPGKLRLLAATGTVGRSVASDTINWVRGEYARQAIMAKLAYVDSASEVALNVVRISDDAASIQRLTMPYVVHTDPNDPSLDDTIDVTHTLTPNAEESFTATLSARVPIVDALRVDAEFGGSIFTRDIAADLLDDQDGTIGAVMEQRLSTRADLAGKLGVNLDEGTWGVALNSTWIGAGYRTLAYPWMQADRLDVTVAPHVRLMDDKLSMRGSLGWRQNNVSQTEEATTSQILGSFNVDAQIGEELAVNAQYSNYGMLTPIRNDTLKVETVAQSISLSPVLTLGSDVMTHVITASVGLDDYDDYNPVSGAAASNKTRSAMGMYAMSLATIPLSVDVAGSWMTNQLSVGDLATTSVSLGAGYQFLDGRLGVGLHGTLTRTALDAAAPDEGTGIRLTSNWRITDAVRLRADASLTSYRYGDSRPGISYNETFLRTSLQFRW